MTLNWYYFIDASGNPVTQSVVGVTDASGNPVTGISYLQYADSKNYKISFINLFNSKDLFIT